MIADIILYAFAFIGFVTTLVFVKFVILTEGAKRRYSEPVFSLKPEATFGQLPTTPRSNSSKPTDGTDGAA